MADSSKTFYLKDGKTLKTLSALAKELKDMTDDVYNHHVNPAKNDFSNWVKHSLGVEELAGKIDKHMDKIEMELHILRHLMYEESKKKPSKKKKVPVSKVKVIKEKAPTKPKVAKKPTPKKAKKVASKKKEVKKNLSKK